VPVFFVDLLRNWGRPPRRVRRKKRARADPWRVALTRDGAFLYQGRAYPVRITRDAARGADCVLEADCVRLNLPSDGLSPDEEAAEVALSLRLWVRKEAKRVFAERLGFWSARLGVAPFRLVITAPLRRWGSCTARNEIRLNWRLLQAPPEILDYVVAHEVCHIPHKNHGSGFWAAMKALMPDVAERRAVLRAWEKRLCAM
jgi:predicted metal-dependent hydrolase